MGTVFGTQMVLFARTSLKPERQTATFETLTQRLRRVWKHKKNILLGYDNASPHTSQTTTKPTEMLDLTILNHILHTVHAWRHATTTFFKKSRKTFVDTCMTQMERWKEKSGPA
jgi:hypothetical protein